MKKEEQKQHIINMMRYDENLGLYKETEQMNVGGVSGSLLSDAEISKYAKKYDVEDINDAINRMGGFIVGAKWSRDTLIVEIERRQQLIMSEPDGIVRETMIANLLVGLQ
jgi:hypothetical protein